MKYKIIAMTLVALLLGVIACGSVMPRIMKTENDRYHQHLEAEEKTACRHEGDVFCTHLPVIVIDTGGVEIPGKAYLDENGDSHYTTTPEGEEEITATVSILDGEECHNHLSDQAAVSTLARVRVRGNSSRHFIKLGYSLNFVDETDANVSHSVMGMDPHHEWVLHGPILDKTLIRNYVWYNVAGEVMDYAPNVRFCEAFINGEYMGLYLMVESVTAGDNDSRLQLSINRKNNTFTGYCLRVDDGSNEIKDLNTFSMYTYQTEGVVDSVYPGTSNLTPEMKARIQKDFSAFERILYSGDYNDPRYGYEAYIDVDSFVDYFILNEFSSNYDAGARSTYIYKEVGGPYKLCVWDFNSALDNYQEQAVDPEMFLLQNRVWFNALIQDGRFTERVIQRYRELRETYLSEEYLNQYIDETIAYLGDAIDRNNERWDEDFVYDLLIPPERNPDSYEEAVQDMKQYIHVRGEWMDENIDMLRQYIVDPAE
jgi:hypothetical protein